MRTKAVTMKLPPLQLPHLEGRVITLAYHNYDLEKIGTILLSSIRGNRNLTANLLPVLETRRTPHIAKTPIYFNKKIVCIAPVQQIMPVLIQDPTSPPEADTHMTRNTEAVEIPAALMVVRNTQANDIPSHNRGRFLDSPQTIYEIPMLKAEDLTEILLKERFDNGAIRNRQSANLVALQHRLVRKYGL